MSSRLLPLVLAVPALAAFPLALHAQTVTTLYNFTGGDDGLYPDAGLVQGLDGYLYGATTYGGSNFQGRVFKIALSGSATYKVIYSFPADQIGPATALFQGGDSNLYDTVENGGDDQAGLAFKVTEAGAYTQLNDFSGNNAGSDPQSGVIEGSDGNFYGAAGASGMYDEGNIFQLTPAGVLTAIYAFGAEKDSEYPNSGLVQGTDGDFYGAASGGVGTGVGSNGAIFKMTSAGAITVLYDFTGGNDGETPNATLAEGPDGNFYGTTTAAGVYSMGTLFSVTPQGKFTLLHSFTNGLAGQLVAASDGLLYGRTLGNTPAGTLFSYNIATGAFAQLVTFTAQSYPAPVLQASDGAFYFVSTEAGTAQSGAIFKVALSPALPPPVQLTFASSTINAGGSATLNWTVSNAFSGTLQQCYQFIPNLTAAGVKLNGSYSNGIFSGTSANTITEAGTYTFVITCGGTESGYATLTVKPAAVAQTATTLTFNPNPVYAGNSVGVTVAVKKTSGTGFPTGTVALSSGTSPLGTFTLGSAGTSSMTAVVDFVPNNYPVTATYSGDSQDAASSDTVNLLIKILTPTTTTLTVTPNPVTSPATVSATATVKSSSGTPTGMVTLSANGQALVSGALTNGTLTVSESSASLPPGSYTVTAAFAGNTPFANSTSAGVAVTVK